MCRLLVPRYRTLRQQTANPISRVGDRISSPSKKLTMGLVVCWQRHQPNAITAQTEISKNLASLQWAKKRLRISRSREPASWQSKESHKLFPSRVLTSGSTVGHSQSFKALITPNSKRITIHQPQQRHCSRIAARKDKYTVGCSTEIPTHIQRIKILATKLVKMSSNRS